MENMGPESGGLQEGYYKCKFFFYFSPFFNDRELKMLAGDSISAKMETARNMPMDEVMVKAHPPYSGNQVS